MFNKIWKEQIVKPSSNVGIFKPKQGFDLEEDKDDDCNKQLQEYANKIKNTPLPMKEVWNSKEFEIYKPYFNNQNPNNTQTSEELFFSRKKETIEYGYGQHINQTKTYIYNPIPENIACKAVEILEKFNMPEWYDSPVIEDIDDYTISLTGSSDVANSFLVLRVRKGQSGKILVQLELYRSENISTHTLPKGPIEGRGFFTVSGFYLRTDWR